VHKIKGCRSCRLFRVSCFAWDDYTTLLTGITKAGIRQKQILRTIFFRGKQIFLKKLCNIIPLIFLRKIDCSLRVHLKFQTWWRFLSKKLPPNTLAGFVFTTHNSASRDLTTRPLDIFIVFLVKRLHTYIIYKRTKNQEEID
jgi:hypothetical protein